MDIDKAEKIKLATVIVCFLLAIIIFGIQCFGGKTGRRSGPTETQFLCVNENCGAEFVVSSEEFREKMTGMPPGPMMMSVDMLAFECPECGKKTGYRAIKCLECEHVFIQGDAGDDRYPDRCPECKHSPSERR